MDRLGGIMIRDVHKIKLDNNHFYGDGESIAGIILRLSLNFLSKLKSCREMRQGDKELTHHNLGEEIRQRLKQLKVRRFYKGHFSVDEEPNKTLENRSTNNGSLG